MSYEQMALDKFLNTLNSPRLQQHLLAIKPTNLTKALTAGNEVLLIRQTQFKVKQMELEEKESELGTQVNPVRTSPPITAPVAPPATVGMVPPTHSVVTQLVPVQPNPAAEQPTLAVQSAPTQPPPLE